MKSTRSRSRHLLALAAVATLVYGMALVPAANAQGGVPAAGDWVIDGPIVVSDQDVSIRGNVIIRSSGDLSLQRSTLTMAAAPPTEPFIEVEAGGVLRLIGSPDRPSAIVDTPHDTDSSDPADPLDFHYRLLVNGSLVGHDCQIEGVGIHYSKDQEFEEDDFNGTSGFITTGNQSLADCKLQDRYGVMADGGTIDWNGVTTIGQLMDLRANHARVRISDSHLGAPIRIAGGRLDLVDTQLTSSLSAARVLLTGGKDNPLQALIERTTISSIDEGWVFAGNSRIIANDLGVERCKSAIRVNAGANVTINHLAVHACRQGFLVSDGSLVVDDFEAASPAAGSGAVLPGATAIIRNASATRDNVLASQGAIVHVHSRLIIMIVDSDGQLRAGSVVVQGGTSTVSIGLPGGEGPVWVPFASFDGDLWTRSNATWTVTATSSRGSDARTIAAFAGSFEMELHPISKGASAPHSLWVVTAFVAVLWIRRRASAT